MKKKSNEKNDCRDQAGFHSSLEVVENIINATDDSVAVIDFDGHIFLLNEAAARRLGSTVENLQGKIVYEFLPEDVGKARKSKVQEMFRIGVGERFQDSRSGWHLDHSIAPIFGKSGNVEACAIFARDITELKSAQEKARNTAQTLKILTDSLPACIARLDCEHRYTFVNKTFETWFDIPKAKCLGNPFADLIGLEQFATIEPDLVQVLSGKHRTFEFKIESVPAGERCVQGDFVPHIVDGEVRGYFALLYDITDQKNTEKALRDSGVMLALINQVQNAFIQSTEPDQVFNLLVKNLLHLTESEFGILEAVAEEDTKINSRVLLGVAVNHDSSEPNHSAVQLQTILQSACYDEYFNTSDPGCIYRDYSGNIQNPTEFENLCIIPLKQKEIVGFFTIANGAGGFDRNLLDYLQPYLATCAQILDAHRSDQFRRQAEQTILDSLTLKDSLLREIHHRIKNNLSIVISLLGMQSHYVGAKGVKEIFADIQDRVRAMALAHEKLYQSHDLAELDIKDYLESLIDCIEIPENRINVKKAIGRVFLPLETAILIGFILTELLLNCFKHAFQKNEQGIVMIKFEKTETGEMRLMVKDNGIGFEGAMLDADDCSMGMKLVRIFCQQLGAKFTISNNSGTEVFVTF